MSLKTKNVCVGMALGLWLAVACSSTSDGVDAATTDSGGVDAVATDSGGAIDGNAHGDAGGMPCGTGTCGTDEVCCAASGPTMPEHCTAPDMCTNILCDGPADCTGGTLCCTDGIQSLCTESAFCFERACGMADDCDRGEVCCPFGDGQNACRTNC